MGYRSRVNGSWIIGDGVSMHQWAIGSLGQWVNESVHPWVGDRWAKRLVGQYVVGQ